MIRQVIPILVVVLLLFTGAVFAFFESVYLQDQVSELGAQGAKVIPWMWVFRLLTFAFSLGSLGLLYQFFKRLG